MRIVTCITGASGVVYGIRLINVLSSLKHEVLTVISKEALNVINHECLCRDELIDMIKRWSSGLWFEDELSSPLTSSSFLIDAVVVAPCSLKTLSDIASSRQGDLISRVACNALRMRRRLILLIRETPLSLQDIRNMLLASESGAIIMPAAPAFYQGVKDVTDLIDFIVGKALDVLGIENDLYRRWGGEPLTRETLPCAQLFCSEGS